MARTHYLVAPQGGPRLDRFLADSLPELTRSHLKKLIDDGFVTIAGHTPKPSLKLKPGDPVSLTIPDPVATELLPQAIPLAIVYEDEDLLVVDKPAGLTVHPGPGHPDGTLVNAVLAHCPDLAGIKGSLRPGIVHRLDKDTSGLIIVAKNDYAQAALSRQMQDRSIEKRYVALVNGVVKTERQVVDGPIGRDPRNRKRMAVTAGGRQARTECQVLERLEGHTLVACTLITGRTHQIRVHLSYLGHPVTGDPMYGGRSPLLERQFLHAARLRFRHPRTGVSIECESPLPPDLQRALVGLGSAPIS